MYPTKRVVAIRDRVATYRKTAAIARLASGVPIKAPRNAGGNDTIAG
jgi:hypothetical protein